jgi:transposase InsO family protein
MDEGWLYLAVVIDLFSRQVVDLAMHERMTRQLVIYALRTACFGGVRQTGWSSIPSAAVNTPVMISRSS